MRPALGFSACNKNHNNYIDWAGKARPINIIIKELLEMKILILGGTVFLGRHLAEIAQQRGHEVTLFNRGNSNPDLFPHLERLRGDRDGDLKALRGHRWDAVIDTCGYVPRIVGASAALLADVVDHYTFISSMSVYENFQEVGITEEFPVGKMEDETVEEVTGESYGPLKASCEAVAEAAMPGRVLTIRPGLIVGPHDPTDRFTYWPHRVARGGAILVPGNPQDVIQFIDVRDLAEWNIRLVEQKQTGVIHASGPQGQMTMGALLDTSRAVSDSDATFIWMDEDFLLARGVAPWSELPLWIPGDEFAGFSAFNLTKAIQHGLTFRPLAETVMDTLAWSASRPEGYAWRAGLKPEREKELLQAWKAANE
jgi:2'-hydroxyisoflavone reductase